MKWITDQITGELLRDVTNKATSVLLKTDILYLDKFVLPWAIDAFEEQMLFAMKPDVSVHFIGMCNTSAFVFSVSYGNAVEGDEDPDILNAAIASGSREVPPIS
jgi:hypothetical protein